MSSGDEKTNEERPRPDHEAIEALLAADPRCEKDDSPDDEEEGRTTITFLSREAAERLKAQQERRENE